MKLPLKIMYHPGKKQGLMLKGLNVIAIFALVMVLLSSSWVPATAGTSGYYVSTNGSDKNPGTLSQPWKTLLHAGQVVRAGDTLYIRGGRYQEHFYIYNSGTQSYPITVTNYNDEEVIIDGKNMSLPPHDSGTPLIGVLGDWVIVRNLTIANSGEYGITVEGNYDFLNNLFVHHSWKSGVVLQGNYANAQQLRVWSNAMDNAGGILQSSWGAGIYCGRYPDYCTIRNNLVWENWGEGINTGETLHPRIEGNIVYNNMQNIYVHDTKYAVVQRNFSYYTPGNSMDAISTTNGILVGDEHDGVPIPLGPNGTRYPSSDNTFTNNVTFGGNHGLETNLSVNNNNLYANNTFGNSAGDTGEPVNILFNPGSCVNCNFINNLIIQDDARSIVSVEGSGMAFSNNLWTKMPPASASGAGDVIGDPLLLKTGDPNSPEWYTLTESSPAVGSAQNLSFVRLDFFRLYRGDPPDIGAVEQGPIQPRETYLPVLQSSGN